MTEKIGNTEALEKYLQLERDNKYYQDELENYRKTLGKSRQAYSDLSKKVDALFQWIEEEGLLETAGKKMALLFEFAYMEAHFEDLRAKWPSETAKAYAAMVKSTDMKEAESQIFTKEFLASNNSKETTGAKQP